MNEAFFIRKRLVNKYISIRDFFPDALLLQNKKFKNLHQGERCFILGSGPSIKEQDLTLLKGEIVMTQNHFHSHKDIDVISPKYHVVVPKFHPKEYDEDWVQWIQGMEEKLPNSTTLFFGKNTKSMVETTTNLGDRSFYIQTGYHAVVSRKARVDLTQSIFNVPTVITQCITIALYMGFKEIHLAGFDLDQIFQRSKGGDKMRFYGHSEITKNKAELDGLDKSFSTGRHFFNTWLTWRQLILLGKYAESKGIKITNVAAGGILEIFPRYDFESVVNHNFLPNQ